MVGSIRPEGIGGPPEEVPFDTVNKLKQQVDEVRGKLQALKLKPETPPSTAPKPMNLVGRFVPRLGQEPVSPNKQFYSADFFKAADLIIPAFSAKIEDLWNTFDRSRNPNDQIKVEQFIRLVNNPFSIFTDPNIDDRTKIEMTIQEFAHSAEIMPSEAKFFTDLQAQLNQILK